MLKLLFRLPVVAAGVLPGALAGALAAGIEVPPEVWVAVLAAVGGMLAFLAPKALRAIGEALKAGAKKTAPEWDDVLAAAADAALDAAAEAIERGDHKAAFDAIMSVKRTIGIDGDVYVTGLQGAEPNRCPRVNVANGARCSKVNHHIGGCRTA
jgi:hypothetical protein